MQSSSVARDVSWSELLGSWRCVALYTETRRGSQQPSEREYPFGQDVDGFLTYTRSGDVVHMHALITSALKPLPGRQTVELGTYHWASRDDAHVLRKADGHVIVTHYHGTAALEREPHKGSSTPAMFVVHKVHGSQNRAYVARELRRAVQLSEDRQTLTLVGQLGMAPITGIIVWRREGDERGGRSKL